MAATAEEWIPFRLTIEVLKFTIYLKVAEGPLTGPGYSKCIGNSMRFTFILFEISVLPASQATERAETTSSLMFQRRQQDEPLQG